MKKIIITIAAMAALSTMALANEGGNDSSTFGDGLINGAPAPQNFGNDAGRYRRINRQSNFYFGTNDQGYTNYFDPADQPFVRERNRAGR